MAKRIIMTEKPSVAKDVAVAILKTAKKEVDCIKGIDRDGIDVTIVWARGHLLELADPKVYDERFGKWDVTALPIVPPAPWKFKEVVKSSARDVFSSAKKHIKEHDGEEIINACDAGREGELIFRKVVDNIGLKKPKLTRMWFSSMTKSAILDAYNKRKDITLYDGLATSGYTRDQADWVVGMNMSVLATKTLPRGYGDWKVWSVGRVQTPTLALVAERDDIIKNFNPEKYWEVSAIFESTDGKSIMDEYYKSPKKLSLVGESKNKETKKVFWKKELAEQYLADSEQIKTYNVEDVKTESISNTPLPLNLIEMQKICSRKYSTTGAVTLNNLQTLYEKKLISYPRTDSRYFQEDMKDSLYASLQTVLNTLKTHYPDLQICKEDIMSKTIADKSKAYNDKGVGDHYALCPTGEIAGIEELDSYLLNTYILVIQYTLMSLDEAAKYDIVTRTWTQEDSIGNYADIKFKTSKKSIKFAGWTRWKNEAEEGVVELPEIKGSKELLKSASIKELETTPPKHYDDASLLTAMELAGKDGFDNIEDEDLMEELIAAMKGRGLGTPATRTSIIEKLIQRNYLRRDKKSIISTDNGAKLVNELRAIAPESISPQITAEWELMLAKMEENSKDAITREVFLDNLLKTIEKNKELFIEKKKASIVEGKPLEEYCPRSGKPIMDYVTYYVFPGYPKVRLYKETLGRVFTIENYKDIFKAIESETDLFWDLKSKAGKEFKAQFKLDEKGKFKLEFPEVKVDKEKVDGHICPKSNGKIEDCGMFYLFEGYPKIKFYKKAFGKEFTLDEVIEIVQSNIDGDPKEWELYSDKKKKNYKAKILIDKDKLRLAF